jgi:hypothetical protein
MRLSSALIAALLLMLAACAAPTPANPGEQAAQPAPSSPVPSSPAAPDKPTVPPLPESATEPVASGGTVAIDRSCKTDADCTVKNVGNCCGYYPACVNVNSPTDPKGVQAECAKKGMMSVCGFPEISSCSCKQGTCEAASAAVAQ